jgi:YgiT-type zinc finger domain-containing protein
MNCRICAGTLHPIATDLPFKVSAQSIVIITKVPVLQCDGCSEYVVSDAACARVEQVLEGVDKAAELEIVPFAA